jgi:hypothetical protein
MSRYGSKFCFLFPEVAQRARDNYPWLGGYPSLDGYSELQFRSGTLVRVEGEPHTEVRSTAIIGLGERALIDIADIDAPLCPVALRIAKGEGGIKTQVTWLSEGFGDIAPFVTNGTPVDRDHGAAFWIGDTFLAGLALHNLNTNELHPLQVIQVGITLVGDAQPLVLPVSQFDRLTHNGKH